MKNDLFTIGSITIHGYGLMIGIGIIAAYYIHFIQKGLTAEQSLEYQLSRTRN